MNEWYEPSEYGPSYDIVELPVQRWAARADLDQRRSRRNVLTGGRTAQAAARLARYRLRKAMRSEGLTPVGDFELMAESDIMRDELRVAASVRCIKIPWPFEGSLTATPSSVRVAMIRPPDEGA